MVDPRLITEIQVQRKSGRGDADVRKILHVQGFSEAEIFEAFAASDLPTAAPVAVPGTPVVSAAALVVTPSVSAATSKRALMLGLAAVVIALSTVGGGAAYTYIQKIGPFATVPYTERDLVAGLLAATSRIQSNTYSVIASIDVEPRDTDAQPFELVTSNAEETREKYANDYERVRTVTSLLSGLRRMKGQYPSSLQAAASAIRKANSYSPLMTITDPRTNEAYIYRATESGRNFELVVTFETSDAIAAIRRISSYGSEVAPIVQNQTVTFTKDSNSYFYVPSEQPKPYIVQLAEWLRFLPADVSASLSASASVDWENVDSQWKFNVDATGDFGDLAYKVNADALKKSDTYYFRVNNFPSIFGTWLASVKGKWVKIVPSEFDEPDNKFSRYSYIASSISKSEKQYKESREEFVAFIRSVAKIADEEQLVALKQAPISERIDGNQLYRYDISINKASILPFYKRMVKEAEESESVSQYELFTDTGVVAYLESDEFNQVFDYLDKNINIRIWVDSAGYPARIEYTMRIIPPDTAKQLKDNQIKLVLSVGYTDINKPVSLDVPSDFIDLKDLIADLQANDDYELR